MNEFLYERALARWIARVRLILTVANFIVISLDRAFSDVSGTGHYAWGMAAAFLYFSFALFLWLRLDRGNVNLDRYLLISPAFDVLFASLLIISTRGYLSPFQLWTVFAVACSGFSRHRWLPVVTALLGILAHCLIAMIPQERAMNIAGFAVRTAYLFGFAAIFSSIGSSLAAQSRMLAIIEDTGRRMAGAMTQEEIGRLLLDRVAASIESDGIRLKLADGFVLEHGELQSRAAPISTWSLESGREPLGALELFRPLPVSRERDAFIRVLCDRTASSLIRIRLSNQLVRAAAAAERLKLSDQLHDTYIQTLSALDMRVEVARQLVGGSGPELEQELATIKQIARTANAQARQMIRAQEQFELIGPDSIRDIVAQRWFGGAEIDIPADLRLSENQWRIIEMLVKEGINNVVRHAKGASCVHLRVYRNQGGAVVCRLENDGAPASADVRFGYGLSRLRAVVEQEGGHLSFEPSKPGGAALEAEFGAAA